MGLIFIAIYGFEVEQPSGRASPLAGHFPFLAVSLV